MRDGGPEGLRLGRVARPVAHRLVAGRVHVAVGGPAPRAHPRLLLLLLLLAAARILLQLPLHVQARHVEAQARALRLSHRQPARLPAPARAAAAGSALIWAIGRGAACRAGRELLVSLGHGHLPLRLTSGGVLEQAVEDGAVLALARPAAGGPLAAPAAGTGGTRALAALRPRTVLALAPAVAARGGAAGGRWRRVTVPCLAKGARLVAGQRGGGLLLRPAGVQGRRRVLRRRHGPRHRRGLALSLLPLRPRSRRLGLLSLVLLLLRLLLRRLLGKVLARRSLGGGALVGGGPILSLGRANTRLRLRLLVVPQLHVLLDVRRDGGHELEREAVAGAELAGQLLRLVPVVHGNVVGLPAADVHAHDEQRRRLLALRVRRGARSVRC